MSLMLPSCYHLADLIVKAGLKNSTVNINQIFVDIHYYFYHSSKCKQDDVQSPFFWCSYIDHFNRNFKLQQKILQVS